MSQRCHKGQVVVSVIGSSPLCMWMLEQERTAEQEQDHRYMMSHKDTRSMTLTCKAMSVAWLCMLVVPALMASPAPLRNLVIGKRNRVSMHIEHST